MLLGLFITQSLVLPLFCILTTALITIFLFYKRTKDFIGHDQLPELKYLAPTQNISQEGTQAIVQTGLFINSFLTFDVIKNNFVIDGIIWFKFNPSLITIDTIEQFTIEKAKILSLGNPETRLIDSHLFVQYAVRFQFSPNLDYHYFPLEDHQICIVITNSAVSPQEVRFESISAGFLWYDHLYIPGWKIIDKEVKTGFISAQLDTNQTETALAHPRVVFILKCERKGTRNVLTVMLPIFLAFVIGYLSLTLNPHKNEASMMILSSGSLTGLIAYRFVLQQLTPDVGYFTLTDYLYSLFLVATFTTFLIDLSLVALSVQSSTLALIKNSAYIILPFIICTAQYYILYFLLSSDRN